MNLQSDFFRTLEQKRCWWVIRSIESQDARVNGQLEEFDRIAFAIENSSSNNKRLLQSKCQNVLNRITPGRTNFVISRKPQPISLPELYADQPILEKLLERAYAENVFRASVLSEIKAFDELVKLDFNRIELLEEEPNRKMPDFKAVQNGQNIFIEVKCIHPEKLGEQRMMYNLVEFVEPNINWFDKIKNKISDALKDAKAKFESVNAYAENCKRYVYLSIIWLSSDATSQHETPEKLIGTLTSSFETEFGIEIRFFKTF